MQNIYAVYDKIADEYIGAPFFAKADPAAIRTFGDIIAAGNNAVAQHPEDYTLNRLATVDGSEVACERDTIITGAQIVAARTTTQPELA